MNRPRVVFLARNLLSTILPFLPICVSPKIYIEVILFRPKFSTPWIKILSTFADILDKRNVMIIEYLICKIVLVVILSINATMWHN